MPILLHSAWCTCRHWLSPGFLAGWIVASTITFPLEHYLWDVVWPFHHYSTWQESQGFAPWWLSVLILAVWVSAMVFAFLYTVRRQDVN